MFDGGGGGGYSSASECCFADINTMARKKKSTPTTNNNNNNNKRRFSDEQIRSLEVIFESETKLEPTKKAQLAKDLGLQPRQVAIWFQNKRARWKSKQIEKDYGLLLSNYNNLASQFECLRKEKQSLLIQLQDLKNGVERNSENKNLLEIDQETAGNSSSEGESGSTKKIDFDANSISSKHLVGMLSDGDDISMKAEFMGLQDEEDDHELLKMVGPGVESTLTSSEDWGASLDSDGQNYDHQLWDFWC